MNEEAVGATYIEGLLQRALTTSVEHESADVRDAALGKATKFRRVLDGLRSGLLDIGSRTPVNDLPAWVTPEVVRGGFATGTAAAAVPISPIEAELIERLGASNRAGLFAFLVSAPGQSLLLAAAKERTVHLEQPEQVALVVIAWLLANGDVEAALAIRKEISDFGARLRFCPHLRSEQIVPRDQFRRWNVGEVKRRLQTPREQAQVETMQCKSGTRCWTSLGGAAFEFRFGAQARSSSDIDTIFRGNLDEAVGLLSTAIETGWSGLS